MSEPSQHSEDATQPAKQPFLSRLSRGFRRGAIWMENSALFLYLRGLSRAGIILIALGFFLDMDQRQAATLFRAWQTLTNDAPGNVGKADAMAYLVSTIDRLSGIAWLLKSLVQDPQGCGVAEVEN